MIDRIRIEKSKRILTAYREGEPVFRARVALGKAPVGPKRKEGDMKTPEGLYYVCIVKECGKYGPSLGISYPSPLDAELAGAPCDLAEKIRAAWREKRRPPWGSSLGGEIYIHGGGSRCDWTSGCVALDDDDAKALFDMTPLWTEVEILP